MARNSKIDNIHPAVGTAVIVGWSMPATVATAMVCPPALLVAPVVAAVATGRSRRKRKAAIAAEEQYRQDTWGGWAG